MEQHSAPQGFRILKHLLVSVFFLSFTDGVTTVEGRIYASIEIRIKNAGSFGSDACMSEIEP